MTSAIECSMGVSVVKGEGRAVFPLNLSMLSPVVYLSCSITYARVR